MRIGIDLGGTTVKAALCTEEGKILQRDNCITPVGDPDALKRAMCELADKLCAAQKISHEEITSIGIGVPGSLDAEKCCLLFGPNVNMKNVYFGDTFADAFSCPVRLGNDANCAALGEATAGAAGGVPNVIMVTLGTGVGGGIIINGKLYTGFNGIAGELGHIVIRQNGEPCNCGRHGCLEAYAAAASFVRFAERALDEGAESMLSANKGKLNAKMICDAVDAGDSLAKKLFDEYCVNLACGLANFINIFQPDCIVLGGGLAGYGEKLLAPLRKLVTPETYRTQDKNTEIVCASLGNDAGLIGAAML